MALAYYMDVQIPSAISEGLRRCGIDVLTSQEDGTRRATDEQLLQRATALGRILVTHDEDFLVLAAAWQATGWEFSGIVFAPQMGASIGRYIDDLELIAVCSDMTEMLSQVQRLPLP
jgi:hypothetical protein